MSQVKNGTFCSWSLDSDEKNSPEKNSYMRKNDFVDRFQKRAQLYRHYSTALESYENNKFYQCFSNCDVNKL